MLSVICEKKKNLKVVYKYLPINKIIFTFAQQNLHFVLIGDGGQEVVPFFRI